MLFDQLAHIAAIVAPADCSRCPLDPDTHISPTMQALESIRYATASDQGYFLR